MANSLITFAIVSLIFSLLSNCYVAEKAKQQTKGEVKQETEGDQSPAVYVSPGGSSVIKYDILPDRLIAEILSAINHNWSNSLEAAVVFQKAKIEELNGKLAGFYMQKVGAPEEEARKWAQDIIQKASDYRKEMERNEEIRQEYNREFSKGLLEKLYKLFNYIIFQTVDSRFGALQELNPAVKYEKNSGFILFGDAPNSVNQYTLRTLVLPHGNKILIRCSTGSLRQGIVSTCPSLEFAEVAEQKVIQSFKVIPNYGFGTITRGGSEVQLKQERVLQDVNYLATGDDPLTEQFKKQFEASMQEFFKLAYAR